MSEREPLTPDEADRLLDGVPLVAVLAGSMADIKNARARCLEAGIPVAMGCPPGAGKGWGTRTHLLVEEADIPDVAAVIRGEWYENLAREGLAPVAIAPIGDGDELPCPACGSAAGLDAGACIDCGLQLE